MLSVDTYKYFGEPVYVYSLKDGINDGFLTPFKVKIPAAWYAENRSAKQLMFWGLLLWGTFAALTGVISDVSLLYIDRFCSAWPRAWCCQ
jgi:hypothetical protein